MRTRGPIQTGIDVVFVALLGGAFWAGRAPDATAVNSFGFSLHEVAHQSGIDFVHHEPKLDPKLANIEVQIAGVGASVSAVDVDNDGWVDLYATNSAFGFPNALYMNLHDGRFVDRAAAMGLADLNREGEGVSMGSIWGDFDGDGDEDVFVYRYGYQALYRNDGGHFVDVSEQAGVRRWMNSNCATWIDYDRDGRLDLYVCGYFREDVDLWHVKTTRIMQSSFEFSNNGGHNYLFHNLGNGKFEDVTAKAGVDSTRWTLAVAAADMNGDGWQDLYLANDYGPEELFLNNGDGTFRRAENIGLDESSKSGMSVSLGDFEGDGRLGVYVTNISKQGYLFQGNNLRVNRLADHNVLRNVVEGDAINCGWSWGAQFGDLNNDGLVDLYVVNGFISANRESDYWFDMTKLAIGAGEIAEDAANWPPQGDRSLSGYERSSVLVNRGHLHFVDAAAAVGADDLYDGRAIVLADLWNRGVQDVVIANQAGPLLVYKNTVEPPRHWIQILLAGTQSGHDAFGAEVLVEANGHKQAQVVLSANGFSAQADRRLHFGLGDATSVERVTIRWPAGTTQVIEHPRIDRLMRIEEGAR